MQNIILYVITLIFIIISFYRDKKKTKMAMKKAWKAFENILPQFLGVIMLVGVMLAVLNPEVIWQAYRRFLRMVWGSPGFGSRSYYTYSRFCGFSHGCHALKQRRRIHADRRFYFFPDDGGCNDFSR